MLNICLVGTGLIGTQHAIALQAIGDASLRWVVSGTDELAREFGQRFSAPRTGSDLTLALADPGIDLVLIASPSAEHARQAIQALRAGKHVIVEIPLALSLADAEAVQKTAAEVQRRVFVCHTMRSFPAIREIRRRAVEGQFHLSHIVSCFTIPRRRNQSSFGIRNWIDNLLWHHGCHLVDAAMWLLGVDEFDQVNALLGKTHPVFGMATDASVQLRTGASQLVTIAMSYNTEQFWYELRCLGDENTLVYRNGDLLDEKDEKVLPYRSWQDVVDQDTQILARLRDGAASDFDINAIMPCMRVLNLAQQSIDGAISRSPRKTT